MPLNYYRISAKTPVAFEFFRRADIASAIDLIYNVHTRLKRVAFIFVFHENASSAINI